MSWRIYSMDYLKKRRAAQKGRISSRRRSRNTKSVSPHTSSAFPSFTEMPLISDLGISPKGKVLTNKAFARPGSLSTASSTMSVPFTSTSISASTANSASTSSASPSTSMSAFDFQPKLYSSTNLSLLKQHGADTLVDTGAKQPDSAAEFDYIEHIRRLSSEEYVPTLAREPEAMEYGSFGGPTSIPINIHYNSGMPESSAVGSSLESESMFSPINQSSLSSSASATNSAFTFPSKNRTYSTSSSTQRQRMPLRQCRKIPETTNSGMEFLKFDDNLKDIIDFSKCAEDDGSQSVKRSKVAATPETQDGGAFSLDSYISMLESSLDGHDKRPAHHSPVASFSSSTSTIASTALPGSALLSNSSSFAKSQMPNRPVCENCLTSTTPLWRKTSDNRLLCNACGLFFKLHGIIRPPAGKPKQELQRQQQQQLQLQQQQRQRQQQQQQQTSSQARPSQIFHEEVWDSMDPISIPLKEDFTSHPAGGNDWGWLKFD
ncbi:DEKNAAC103859 [Brettanomyces naardenensis]|uniref:DEKNAAC103859 n=1 Tax=Brettanomyces naardenensis TaxID=13370 RepID=A0A448YPD7_BRENA|nr:DEKNAAC103859 [Brettanomyces naardenensis]